GGLQALGLDLYQLPQGLAEAQGVGPTQKAPFRGVFAHASSYGSRVVIESLEAPFYRKVYRGARRVMASPVPPPGPSAGR
ncbi:MAG: hypothetical protein ACP5P8_10060, partial [Thermus sp.]